MDTDKDYFNFHLIDKKENLIFRISIIDYNNSVFKDFYNRNVSINNVNLDYFDDIDEDLNEVNYRVIKVIVDNLKNFPKRNTSVCCGFGEVDIVVGNRNL